MSKKKIDTNRQAKIARKRQKVKNKLSLDSSSKPKQKSSRDSFRNPTIVKAFKLPEPSVPDCIKMSAVILKIAEPLLIKFGRDEKKVKGLIFLAVMEWNKQFFKNEEQDKLQESMINSFLSSEGNAEDIGSLLHIQDLFAERKNKYFPDLKIAILNYDLKFTDGNFILNVTSAPIP